VDFVVTEVVLLGK